ncbi:hypothetical protein AAGS61_02950 [Lysinibacillus sp. KU-BSD001]|uniref:hypothetical protein n=1 Tax=Lysinibacillus sp. KU-BSD001 TaxID=3141328 RepID=UPI0036E0C1A7
MTDKEELGIKSPSRYFMEQNTLTDEDIISIIERGQFLNAKQGIKLGKLIAAGLVKGLTEPIDLPTRLEGSE